MATVICKMRYLKTLACIMAIIATSLVCGCSDSDEDSPDFPDTVADIVFTANGGSKVQPLGANGYVIDNPSEAEWCQAYVSGSEITVIAKHNPSDAQRSTTYQLSRRGDILNVTVIQQPHAKVHLESAPSPVDKGGGVISVELTSNVPYEVIIPAEADSWIGLAQSNSTTLVFNLQPNTMHSPRSVIITITDFEGNIILTFEITQKGSQPLNEIYYTTTDGSKVVLSGGFGGNFSVLSHTYLDGEGIIVFDGNLLELESSAFSSNKLKSISLPDGIKKIGNYAFSSCSSLEQINIPPLVTELGVRAFHNCTSLKNITLPNGCIINDETFMGCGLENIVVPDGNTRLGDGVFAHCTSLCSISLPEGLEVIESTALYNCTSLNTINIPMTVTRVGDSAFSDCTSLTSIEFPNRITSFGRSCFRGMTGNVSLYPDNLDDFSPFDDFNGKFVIPGDADISRLSGASIGYNYTWLRFGGPLASEDGRCLVSDGTLYLANLYARDSSEASSIYQLPEGIRHIASKAIYVHGCQSEIYHLRFTVIVVPEGTVSIYAPAVFNYPAHFSRDVQFTLKLPSTLNYIGGSGYLMRTATGVAYDFSSVNPPQIDPSCMLEPSISAGCSFRIRVPAESVEAYQTAWPEYAQNISPRVE